jgi:hypothetical protein
MFWLAPAGPTPVVPFSPGRLRAWFSAPLGSAPDFAEPGLLFPGGGRFWADAMLTAIKLAALIQAIFFIIIRHSLDSIILLGNFALRVRLPLGQRRAAVGVPAGPLNWVMPRGRASWEHYPQPTPPQRRRSNHWMSACLLGTNASSGDRSMTQDLDREAQGTLRTGTHWDRNTLYGEECARPASHP